MGAQQGSATSPPAASLHVPQLCLQAASWIGLLQAVRAALSSVLSPKHCPWCKHSWATRRENCFPSTCGSAYICSPRCSLSLLTHQCRQWGCFTLTVTLSAARPWGPGDT